MKATRHFSELCKPNELITQFLDDRLSLKIKQSHELEQLISKALEDLNSKSNNELYARIAETIKDHSMQSMYLNLSKSQELLASISIQLDSARRLSDPSAKDKALEQISSNISSFLAIVKNL